METVQVQTSQQQLNDAASIIQKSVRQKIVQRDKEAGSFQTNQNRWIPLFKLQTTHSVQGVLGFTASVQITANKIIQLRLEQVDSSGFKRNLKIDMTEYKINQKADLSQVLKRKLQTLVTKTDFSLEMLEYDVKSYDFIQEVKQSEEQFQDNPIMITTNFIETQKSFHFELTPNDKPRLTESEAASIIQRNFRRHSVTQDIKFGMYNKDRKMWLVVCKCETAQESIVTISVKKQGDRITSINIVQQLQSGFKSNLIIDVSTLEIEHTEEYINKVKMIVLEELSIKSLRTAGGQIKNILMTLQISDPVDKQQIGKENVLKQDQPRLTESQAASIIQRNFRRHSVTQDIKFGMYNKDRKMWLVVCKCETAQESIVTISVKKQGDFITQINLVQQLQSGLKSNLIIDISTLEIKHTEEYVNQVKMIVQEQLSDKSLRNGGSQIKNAILLNRIVTVKQKAEQQKRFDPIQLKEHNKWSDSNEDSNFNLVQQIISDEQLNEEIQRQLIIQIDFAKLSHEKLIDVSSNPIVIKYMSERVVQALVDLLKSQQTLITQQQRVSSPEFRNSPEPSQTSPIKNYRAGFGADAKLIDSYEMKDSLVATFTEQQKNKENHSSPTKHQKLVNDPQPQPKQRNVIQIQSQLLSRVPTEFKFNSKSQGAIYYLATYGYTRPFSNPSATHIVRAFSSSLYSGRPSDILEKNNSSVNCTTQNKTQSFVGLSLQGRKLVPSAYSFTNTNLWQMKNWQLQASNDLHKWVILDKRQYDDKSEGVHCWGVRQDVGNTYPQGFSSFRIVQTTINSINTHNLSLTHLEIYGEPKNPELWYF